VLRSAPSEAGRETFWNAAAARSHFMVMPRRLVVLLVTLLAVLLSSPRAARAETVLFACSESCPLSLFEALELELRGHGAFLVARLSPSGFSVEAHESDARRMATLVPAAAVLWIEREAPLRVRVLSPGSEVVREAPLATPPEEIEPRIFAAIAGNVVLQAIGAPGHADAYAVGTPASAAAQVGVAATTPIAKEQQESWASKKPKRAKFQRFFLRAGAALGLAFVKSGMPADRAPAQELVNGALSAVLTTNSPEAGKQYLADYGFDCDWQTVSSSFVATHCTVPVKSKGVRFTPGIDIQAGAYLTERLALAAVLRIAPDAGYGTLNHTLFGPQLEYAFVAPASRGFWLNGGFGFAFGRIQIDLDKDSTSNPYASSGPYEAHALVALGYRFVPNFGMYATSTLRVLFPDTLWLLEPTLGVEVRL
jgi:hypothetical protein